MGAATLSIWDPIGQEAIDLPVSWTEDAETDAKIRVPGRFRELWTTAVKILKQDGGSTQPYANLPVYVESNNLTRNAHGFYAIANEIWGPVGVGWKVWPPMPEPTEQNPEVDQ